MEDVELFSSFNLLFGDVKEPVAIIQDSKVLFVNQAASQILGLDRGIKIYSLIEQESHKAWSDFTVRTLKDGQASGEIEFRLKYGKSAILKIRSSCQSPSEQFVVRFEFPVTIPNILSKIDQFDPLFIRIFNSTLTGIMLHDENGVIGDANDKACDFLNLKKHDLIGKSITVVFDLFEDAISENVYMDQVYKHGFAQTVFKSGNEDGGDLRYLQFITSRQGEKGLYMTIIKDETERELMKYQIEHHTTLSTLGQMAASIAHEIRNPMTSLKGFAELLKMTTNEEGKTYLSVIDEELNRMDSILNEFLILSKPSKMDKVVKPMHEIVLDVMNIMQPQATMHNVFLQYEQLADRDMIYIEPNRMKQVLINLLKNAIEVSENGQHIWIKTELENKKVLCLSVTDEGRGLSEHQIEQIFVPFFTTKRNGTGLGLPFVLKTVEDHGGSVRISSKLGEGTTFQLLLPLCGIQENKSLESEEQLLT